MSRAVVIGGGIGGACAARVLCDFFDEARPMLKYLAVLAVGLALLIFVPEFSLWLPGYFGLR